MSAPTVEDVVRRYDPRVLREWVMDHAQGADPDSVLPPPEHRALCIRHPVATPLYWKLVAVLWTHSVAGYATVALCATGSVPLVAGIVCTVVLALAADLGTSGALTWMLYKWWKHEQSGRSSARNARVVRAAYRQFHDNPDAHGVEMMEVDLEENLTSGDENDEEQTATPKTVRPASPGARQIVLAGHSLTGRVTLLGDVWTLIAAAALPGTSLLFWVSLAVVVISHGTQLLLNCRVLLGLLLPSDVFAIDKPDLFLKGDDGRSMGRAPFAGPGDAQQLRSKRAATKLAGACAVGDLPCLHALLVRYFVPLETVESVELQASLVTFSQCFCSDCVQIIIKVLLLTDFNVDSALGGFAIVQFLHGMFACCTSMYSGVDEVEEGE